METSLKIAICDDEKVIATDIQQRISQFYAKKGVVHNTEIMTNPLAILVEERTPYDVIFLDVDMGEWNGINVAEHLRQYDSSLIIVYISGYIKYSPHGYKVNAFRYLLKNELDETLEECLDDVYKEHLSRPECLTIKCGADSLELKIDEIMYIESQDPVRIFYVLNHENMVYKSYEPMQNIEERLPPKTFLRIQRSYIVNLAHVSEIKNYQVTIGNGVKLPTNRSDFSDLRRKFMLWKGR